MPHSNLHIKKKTKNYIFLAAIAAWIVLIWSITMIKLANG